MGHLTTEERYTIEKLKAMDYSTRAIAATLGRSHTTISREILRFGKRKKYRSAEAARAAKKRRRPSANGYRVSEAVQKTVRSLLKQKLSPEQITGRLRLRCKGLRTQLASAKWIYNFIRTDKKAGGSLYTCLRCQKKRRKKYGTSLKDRRGVMRDRRDISERPAIVEKRTRFGDWEGDLIMGAENHQAIISLVDRATRYALLIKISSKCANETAKAIIKALKKWQAKSRTITFDNGKEFAQFKLMEKALGVTVYFAKPYASYQRGTNENTNGLVRQRFPKSTNFGIMSKKQLKCFETLLNNRPRKCLGFLTPQEKLMQMIN